MEIIFRADKKHRDKYLTAAHFAHPAKMSLPLQRWIVERYTKEGGNHTFTDEMLKEADKQIKWCDCCDT